MPVLALALQILASAAALQPSGTGASPRTGAVEVQGVRLQYVDWGGQGEPLVLVPARCETPFVFGDLAPLLLNQFRVLAMTARGCGGSGLASDGYTLDLQIRDLIGFLDAMNIKRATFAGHSASGGKVVRLARRFPSRVTRIVTFDIIYRDVPDKFESKFHAAMAAQNTSPVQLSLESQRREFEAWELGTWSPALERDFQEQTEKSADGTLRYRRLPDGWQQAFVEDVKQGRYYETAISHPAIFFVARDLDIERLKQFPPDVQRELRPMAEAIRRARIEQIARYKKNGSHVRVVWMERASHYLFVDRAREVAKQMLTFLVQTR
jgi:pimeloyl-ACP methyl ester carboxylesterase